MYHQFPSATEAFLNYFDVDLAATQKARDQVGRLRYRVYCEEFGYEQAAAFPSGKETDHFDEHSLHCMITHRKSRATAACVRLVCATANRTLPLETYCLESLHSDYLDALVQERDQVCEVSRLAVDPAFRRRRGERHTRLGEFNAMDCCHQEQRTFSLISIAAVLAGFAMSTLTERTSIFTMMEANLPRLLRRSGILMQQAGDTTDYHGQRSAYFISTEFALSNMRDDLHQLYQAIYECLTYRNDSRGHVA
jgi:N-acyl amino acid synthase of PEP-CTERM/exosortase system